MTDQPIRFRPHHFLCALGFEGKGYSAGFTQNMAGIVVGRLRAPGGGTTEIEVVGAADDICAPCPSRRGTGCESAARIGWLDAAHAQALGLKPGARLSWAEAQDRMKTLPDDALQQICTPCQWLALGMCEAALKRLKAGK